MDVAPNQIAIDCGIVDSILGTRRCEPCIDGVKHADVKSVPLLRIQKSPIVGTGLEAQLVAQDSRAQ